VFGFLHGGIGLLHEFGRGTGKFREKTDADADGGVDFATANLEGPPESVPHSACEFLRGTRVPHAFDNYGELVAADP